MQKEKNKTKKAEYIEKTVWQFHIELLRNRVIVLTSSEFEITKYIETRANIKIHNEHLKC